MISLYVHVPFCVQKCTYCDFVSFPYKPDIAHRYLRALEQEMCYYAERLSAGQKQVGTVFIGGGTPSILPAKDLAWLLEKLQHYFHWQPEAEVTVEANPGTLDKEKLLTLYRGGVNRLSLGVQACQPQLLQVLGRIHNLNQALQAVDVARQVGFNNLSMDLIFAVPGQSLTHWQQSLKILTELEPQHISCYSLQLEDGTPLTAAVDRGELVRCDEDLELAMYNETISFLHRLGYQHYEISNFAQPGFQSKHNLVYWHNQEYLGLGPAAHSHLNSQRWANTGDINQYADAMKKGTPLLTEHIQLTVAASMSETMFMGLRLLAGVNLNAFYRRFGRSVFDVWPEETAKLIKQGLIENTGSHLRLTPKGLPLANIVFAEFV
ncbi:radical SAM family heme chaperone HemW [Peptococcaceae bacterium 1198_IL3148]